eukprot:SAG22_NODE_11605_length_477_cov_1.116402_2_plen_97_part_01
MQHRVWSGEIASVPGWTSSREWDKYPAQTADPVDLEAGQLYYIRAIANEGGGGDNLAVGVTTPAGEALNPIPVVRDGHSYLYSMVDTTWTPAANCTA